MQAASNYVSEPQTEQSLSNSGSRSLHQHHQAEPTIVPSTYPSASNNPVELTPNDLKYCEVLVIGSHIGPNASHREKEVISFVLHVCPRGLGSPERNAWKVEKLYSDILALDSNIRSTLSRGDIKKLGNLPDSKLFKNNAPVKVERRKVALEAYLQRMVRVPIGDPREICQFFNTDVINEANHNPHVIVTYREGYLTKRGRNFGRWKTRYFVLQGSVLEYYESNHLGSINVAGAQIGRQQKSTKELNDENEYRHALLIVEKEKGSKFEGARHVLCAENEQDRDLWVDVLVRYANDA